MRIEDFVISGTDDGDVDLLCPDPAGTCPQWQTAVTGSLGSVIEAARNHIAVYHPMQSACPNAREEICNACGDNVEPLATDGRCHRCRRDGNPAHSWCSHCNEAAL